MRTARFLLSLFACFALLLTASVVAQAQTADPSFTSFTPASPANNNNPTVNGTNNAGTNATITMYDDATCTTSIGSQVAAAPGAFSIGITVTDDTTTAVHAIANDGINGDSNCTSMGTYVEDSTAPTVGTPDMAAGSDSGNSTTDDITNVTTPQFTGTCSDNGLTVTLTSSVNGSVGTDTCTGGMYTITASALTGSAAGTAHTMTASSTDAAGNTGTSGGLAITIDTSANAPSTPDMDAGSDSGSSMTDNITNDTTPQFDGTCEANSTVTIVSSVGGVTTNGTCTGGGAYSITSNGLAGSVAGTVQSITASQVDVAGNSSASSAGLSVTIDTGANAPSVPDLNAASDTGSSMTDNITNDTTPQFDGTCEANGSVTILSSVGAVSTNGSCTGGGAYMITSNTLTGSAAGTVHSITASQVDVAGNSSASSAGLSVTIDTGVGAPSTPDMNAATDSGSSNSDDITNDTTPQFDGTCDPNGTVTITSSVGGVTTNGTCTGGGAYMITSNGLAGSTAGTVQSITASQVDVAGNSSASSAGLSVTIDTAVNVPSAPDLTPATDTGVSNTDNITNDTTPSFGGTCDTDATITITSSVDGVISPTSTCGGGTYTVNSTTVLTGGDLNTHGITASAVDVAGNTAGPSASLSVQVDTNPPNNYSEVLGAPNHTGGGSTYVKSTTNISVNGDDATGSGIDTCQLRINGGAFGNYGTVAAGSLTGTNFNLPAPDGSRSYDVNCTDVAGNTSTNFSNTRVVDDTAPIIQVEAVPAFGATSANNASGFAGWVSSVRQIFIRVGDQGGSGVQAGPCTTTVTPSSTLGATRDANGVNTGAEECSTLSTTAGSAALSSTNFTFGLPRPAPNVISDTFDQDFDVDISNLQDNLGNTTATLMKDFTLDNTPPILDQPQAPGSRTQPNEFGWNNTDVQITWVCNDLQDTRNAGVSPSGVGTILSTGAAIGSSGVSPLISFATLEGENQVAVGTCNDNVANFDSITEGTKRVEQINIDKTAPNVLFGDRTLFAATELGRVFEYPAPGATDNLSGVATPVTCEPTSGSLFPVGITSMICTVADFASNIQNQVFLIRVMPELPEGVVEGDRGQVSTISDPDSEDNGKLLFTFEAFATNGDPLKFLTSEVFLWQIGNPDSDSETATLVNLDPVGNYAFNPETNRYEFVFDTSGLSPGTYELRAIFPWNETLWIRFTVD